MSRAWLIAVGTELLRFGSADTNTVWIADRLERLGVEVVARLAVMDEIEAIEAALRAARSAADLVVATGGLGPTEDDRTRHALARALDLPLRRDADKEAALRRRLESYGVPWSPLQARQADRPEGAAWIENPIGSADGLRIERGRATLVALPGVPEEMRAMVEAGIAGWVGARGRTAAAVARLRVAGCGEGVVEGLLCDLYDAPGIDVTTLGGPDGVDVRVRSVADSPGAAQANLRRIRDAMAGRLGLDLFTEDDRSLSEVVGALLAERGQTLAVAESCTGGMLAAAVTDVPGSSAWFRGGWVVYHDDFKRDCAGIDAAALAREGAVSAEVARRLAEAARARGGADWGIGVTGIAGPGGGSPDKPVGLVHVALAGSGGTAHWKARQPGNREWVRRRSVALALDRLRRALLGAAG